MSLFQRRPEGEFAPARERVADAPTWRPAPGKVTHTMRMAQRYGVHRRGAGDIQADVASVLARLGASTGAPLSQPLAAELGAALGRDVGAVRVHTGTVAVEAARDLRADAFAIGEDIYFGDGAYQPDTERGRHLIAHEVAHTAQQARASGDDAAVEVSRPDDPCEHDADRFADAFTARTPEAAAPSPEVAEPSRILPPTALPMITPVAHRAIARYPYDGGDPPNRRPSKPATPSSPSSPAAKGGKGVKVDVEPIDLFPVHSWSKAWDVVPRKIVPIAQGVVMVDIVPVTYGVEGEYSMGSWASGTAGPATLNAGVVNVDAATAEQLGIGSSPVKEGAHGGSAESDRDKLRSYSGELQGNADLTFSASASAGVNGGASINAKVGLFDIFKVGGFAGLSISGAVNSKASINPRVVMSWRQGSASVESLEVGVNLSGDISVSLSANAGIYVELSPPTIPIVSDLVNALNSVPVIDWLIPDPGTFTWRSDVWKKTWPLMQKSRSWNLSRTLKIAGGSPAAAVASEAAAEPPDFAALVKELEGEGTSEIPGSDPGPKELSESSGSGAVASAAASARGQISNTRKEIAREQKWNATARTKLAERKAKAPAPSGGGGSPSPALAGVGGDAESKLANHAKALDDATGAADKLDGAATRAGGNAGSNLPTRAEAKTALESVGSNADRLGDAVTSGQGKFERPAITNDPAAEAAFEARRRRVQLRTDTVADPVMTEASWTDAQLSATDGCGAIADYRGLLAQHQARVQTLSARLDIVENNLTDAWTTGLAGDFAGANAKLDEVERQLGWVEGQSSGMKAQRPKPTWDDRYAAPDGGQLMLRPEFRGVVRDRFYPSGYRQGTKSALPMKTKVVNGQTYWEWIDPGGRMSPRGDTWWLVDSTTEAPSIDHKPPIATHWNTAGNRIDQKGRADAYNGHNVGLTLMPRSVNSSEGSGGVGYQPQVQITFRGP